MAGRIKADLPEINIVVVPRDHVERVFSAYNMYYDIAEREPVPRNILVSPEGEKRQSEIYKTFFCGTRPTFREYIEYELSLFRQENAPEEHGIIRRGFYTEKVEHYLECCGADNISVIEFNELKARPRKAVENILRMFDVFGATPGEMSSIELSRENSRECSADLDSESREKLDNIYRPHNERLFDLVGKIDWQRGA